MLALNESLIRLIHVKSIFVEENSTIILLLSLMFEFIWRRMLCIVHAVKIN